MEHLSALKGKANPITKQKYFISKQVPEGTAEIRKQTSARLKNLKEANEKKPKEERDQIQAMGDKILVNNELLHPEVQTPTPSQLFPGPQEQAKVDSLQDKFVETESESLRSSEFHAMAIKVHSIQEVNQAYIAVMQRYPAADHIMVGYALKDTGKLKCGFCDDREFGAGQKIKDLIFDSKSKNAAVFVLRKYGGVHLGFQRFGIIQRVATQAIQQLNDKYQ